MLVHVQPSCVQENNRSISLQHNWKQSIPQAVKSPSPATLGQNIAASKNGAPPPPTFCNPTRRHFNRKLKSLRKVTRAVRSLKKAATCLLCRLLPPALLFIGLGLSAAGWILDMKVYFSVGCVLSIAALGAGIQSCAMYRSTPNIFSHATVMKHEIKKMQHSIDRGSAATQDPAIKDGTNTVVSKPVQLSEPQEGLLQTHRRHTVALAGLLELRRLSLAVNKAVVELDQTNSKAVYGSGPLASYASTMMLTGVPILPPLDHLGGAFNWQNNFGYYGYPTARASRLRRCSQWQMPIC